MVTGELKSKVDAIWDAFWSGGIANPLASKSCRYARRGRGNIEVAAA